MDDDVPIHQHKVSRFGGRRDISVTDSRTTMTIFQDISGFSPEPSFFQDIPGLEISRYKFKDFPRSVKTLLANSALIELNYAQHLRYEYMNHSDSSDYASVLPIDVHWQTSL